jgi:putative exporter of polyketide antibiotics
VSLPFRSRVEHAAYPVLDRLERLPRVVPFLAVLVLIVVGILVPRWGFVATALVALAVAFLVYYTWPRLSLPERLMRLAVLALISAVALVQAVPRA